MLNRLKKLLWFYRQLRKDGKPFWNSVGLIRTFIRAFVSLRLQKGQKAQSVDYSGLIRIIGPNPIIALDVGARFGPPRVFLPYAEFIDWILIEPDPNEAKRLRNDGFFVIDKLLGSGEGRGILNITRNPGCSSLLPPTGPFMKFYLDCDLRPNMVDDLGIARGPWRMDIVNCIELPITTISSALSGFEKPIDYLKLDTQGSELDILRGMGKHQPLIIESEISFLVMYENGCTAWEIGNFLHDQGYIAFRIEYGDKKPFVPLTAKGILAKWNNPMKGGLPTHGKIWFMPDWTTKTGSDRIRENDRKFAALMLIFNMESVLKYVLENLETPNRAQILEILSLETFEKHL